MSETPAYQRIPYGVFFREENPFKDTYGGAEGAVFLECHRLRPPRPSSTVVIFTHPIGGGVYLPMVGALAKAGIHVIYANTRYRGNDSALIMEKCLLDLAHVVRHAKEQLGYERVVLGGWSGGGSLSLFYQAEAEDPRLTSTPAGEPIELPAAGLIPADAVLLLAAHVSRAVTLTEWIDPSVLDESAPFERDLRLNLYDPRNPNRAPYEAGFVAEYRGAQIERNRRITSWVQEQLAGLRVLGDGLERCFVVQGTMADPRFLDPALEPSERRPGWCYLGDPRVVNDGPVGLARFCTLRSWLSQWSYDLSLADGQRCGGRVTVPVLVVNNSADEACTPSHARRLYAAISHQEKELVEIAGATHYYFGQPEHLALAVDHCVSFLERHGLLSGFLERV